MGTSTSEQPALTVEAFHVATSHAAAMHDWPERGGGGPDAPLAVAWMHGAGGRRMAMVGAADELDGMLRISARQGAAHGGNGTNGNHDGNGNGTNGNHHGNGSAASVESDVGELYERLRRESPHEVHLMLGGAMDEHLASTIGSRLLMDGVAVHLLLPRFAGLPVHAQVTCIDRQLRVSLFAVRDGRLERALRRILDLGGSVVLLAVLAPLMAAVAGLVWACLGRPVIFAQQRVGRDGRLFRLYKFRSMVANAEEVLRASPAIYQRYVAANFKLPEEEDPRITRLGRLLRRTSLDELPQLWNVLRGDMSLVGPRPIVPEEIAEYGDYGRLLQRVKPGLTGLWQVSGRCTIPYPERARMDLRYVGERSLALDLQLLLRTLPAVISRRGAF
jgi:lipopolysaccharide/colanic/teichoic acid biosynthesis glycosyltransferase